MSEILVLKTADETRTSATTLADSELSFPLSTGTYRVRGILRWTAGAVSDIKIGARITGSTIIWAAGKLSSEATAEVPTRRIGPLFPTNLASGSARVIASDGYNTEFAHAWIDVTFSVEGDGTFEITWAQNTTHTTPAAVLAGSCLIYDRIDELPRLELVHRETENLVLANTAPVDDPVLQIALASNTAYAIEMCLIARSSGTFGRDLLARLVCDGAFDVAHVAVESSQTASTSSFSAATTFSPLLIGDGLSVASAPTHDFGSGADSSTGRGVYHARGHIIVGEGGGTLKVQIGREGNNPGGSARLAVGSWLSAEELPPCVVP